MTITNIISAIGNNRSIYPLILRDCGIEVPSKIYITRKENLKESKQKADDATREKFIDEYATSAVWLGGVRAVETVTDKFIKRKGYNPNVNIKLYKEEEFQGLEYNIKKFKNLAPDAVKDLEKVLNNKSTFEKLNAKKFAAATLIPIAIMGFVLPKANFALTRFIKEKRRTQEEFPSSKTGNAQISMTSFARSREVSFSGNFISTLANFKTVDKMAVTDGGLTIGRVTTSRNKDEAAVNAFRMIGSMFLNFVAPIYIAKILDTAANKLFKINVNLDPLFMENKEFLAAIKENKVDLPRSNSTKDLFEFIDSKPNSFFSRFAQKSEKIFYLENGIRDPRKYVDVKELAKFRTEMENFINSAKKSSNIEKFANRAKYIKNGNIIANILISSGLLAIALPKAQYLFNKFVTGSYSDPGLRD